MVWKRSTAPAAAGAPATAAAPLPSAAPTPPTAGATAAAPLPAVTTPPPAHPPAAETPAPARRGRKPATPAPAQAAPAATVAAPAASAPPIPFTGFLALLMPKDPNAKSALSSLIEGETEAGVPNLFPAITLTGGSTGGSWENHAMNPEGANADMPGGKDPFPAVLLGYRYEVMVWPKVFQTGVKSIPTWKGNIPADEAEAADIAQQAVQRYTFKSKAARTEYDAVGHPNLVLELLVFDERAGLMVVRSSGTYESALQTAKEMFAALPDGKLQPVPVRVQPVTYQTAGSKGQPGGWPEHFVSVKQEIAGEEMDKVKAEFQKFITENGEDPELVKTIAEWSKFSLSDSEMEQLRSIAAQA